MEIFRLIDIGNSTATFYKDGKVFSQKIEAFSNKFEGKKFYYISVNHKFKEVKGGINLENLSLLIQTIKAWELIEKLLLVQSKME